MYKNKSVCIVIPAYNEEQQIEQVLTKIPDYVDKVIIVDDCSKDKTAGAVERLAQADDRIVLLKHKKNLGVGGAMTTGYRWARDNDMDIAVRMDGDGQMDYSDFKAIIDPVAENQVDCTKGNRLFTGEAYKKIPKVRYFGNAILSFLTKISSGYWHIADSQSGYTAINKKTLHLIPWRTMYQRYGQPNDILIRLNVYDLKIRDVPVKPVYNVGEKSGLKYKKVIFTISWLLFKMFLWRMKEKYIIRNFHPLIFFYFLGFIFTLATVILGGRMFWMWHLNGKIPPINALSVMFSFMSASLFTLFAMWFDMESNKDLK